MIVLTARSALQPIGCQNKKDLCQMQENQKTRSNAHVYNKLLQATDHSQS